MSPLFVLIVALIVVNVVIMDLVNHKKQTFSITLPLLMVIR